ncbi:DoxX family protein [Spirosoma sp. KUDC1026]|nr:DoxX family protein [Spirosoma sp. KUDC1026]
MTPKTIKIVYWILTILFSVAMLMDGIAGVVREETGQQVMRQLGYPVYILTIVGTAKILGVVALLQPWFRTIKEWAFAGFTINFVGAMASWAVVSDDRTTLLPPLFMLVFLFVLYYFWTKYEPR